MIKKWIENNAEKVLLRGNGNIIIIKEEIRSGVQKGFVCSEYMNKNNFLG